MDHTATLPAVRFAGLDDQTLDRLWNEGVDDAGHPVSPFTDDGGTWPLRCCLQDSEVGERLAIVSASPFPWDGPYRETGPVVVHAEPCGRSDGSFPEEFEQRRQVVRAFGNADGRVRTQVYDRHRVVEPGQGLCRIIAEALDDPRVEFVHVHNVVSQCYSFAAVRA